MVEVLVPRLVDAEEVLVVFLIESLSTLWLWRSKSGLSFVNCHTDDTGVVCGLAWLVVVLDEVEAADVDVDKGLMLIELRLMNDDVRVVDRVKVVFVVDLVEFDAVEVEDFVGSCFLLTPKNDSSCSRSCRAPDDSRSEARSSFRAVPFVVSLAAVGMCRLKCGDRAGCDGSIGCVCGCEAFTVRNNRK